MAKRVGKRGGRTATLARADAPSERRARSARDFIISKTRTKAAAELNVSSDFFAALDRQVRALIRDAETRATNNGRRTLRPHDL